MFVHLFLRLLRPTVHSSESQSLREMALRKAGNML
jgi:hypothetical protein